MKTKDLLKKVRKIEIKTRRLSNNIFGGEYHSAFKGRGMTFSEVRSYQYGDDVRTIDWNVTARYNEPFVKVFEEERELTLMLLVDISGSEMFGGKLREPLNESSPFDPRSPYAASKVFAHNMTKMYRDSYEMFCTNGILFNHESPLRGQTFVTRKITRALGRIVLGIQEKLTLGNLDASRDWGFAGDYVEGMWKMLQHNDPDDWILATGETHTVKEFLEIAFDHFNLDWEKYILTSEKYYRPNEVEYLLGDYSKAKKDLNWEPQTSFSELVKMMANSDLELAKRDKVLLDEKLLTPTWEHPKY